MGDHATRLRRKKGQRPWQLARHEGWTEWHYTRETGRLMKQAEVVLGSVVDTHKDSIAKMRGPTPTGSAGRSARRNYFKAVLYAQAASLLARSGPLVRELLENERSADDVPQVGPEGDIVYKRLIVEG